MSEFEPNLDTDGWVCRGDNAVNVRLADVVAVSTKLAGRRMDIVVHTAAGAVTVGTMPIASDAQYEECMDMVVAIMRAVDAACGVPWDGDE